MLRFVDRIGTPRPGTVRSRLLRGRIGNVFAAALIVPFLASCAANSATTLIAASQRDGAIAPARPEIQAHLAGRAMNPGRVYFDLGSPLVGPEGLTEETYPRLLRYQIEKGFHAAQADRGQLPASSMDIAIEQLKFTRGSFLIPDPSILRVRMEVRAPGGMLLMKGAIESRYMPTVPIMATPGVITPVATGFKGQEYAALSKMIPALAVVCTRIAAGLQDGKTLDEIEVYPNAYVAGGYVGPDSFLKHEPFGLKALTADEIRRATGTNEPMR